MIPIRLEVRGFLTFRETQVLDFSGVHSAVIIGPNGVGKSALFDAITFALFGGHRGGKSGAEHLLHQGANELAVRFDFEFREQLYRVERTLTRKVGRKHERFVPHAQALVWDGSRFKEIPETEGSDACKAWVERTLGMDFAACCASVLLRQNDHDQFLRAGPAERQKILNALLDLEPYRRLEQAARAGWQRAATEARALDEQIKRLPAHDADTIADFELQLADAATDRELLETCWVTARDRLIAAQAFTDLQQRLDRYKDRLAEYRSVIEDADQTLADAERHGQLTRMVPFVQEALNAQEAMQQADQDAAVAAGEAAALNPAGLWEVYAAKKAVATNALTKLAAVEQRDTALRAELQALRPLGDALVRADAARAEAADYRAKAAPLDADAASADSDAAEVARLQMLERDRPWLEQLHASRQERAEADTQLQALLGEIEAGEAALPELLSGIDAAVQALTTARRQRGEAEQARAEARAMLAQKQQELHQREQAQGEQTCSRCGARIDHTRIADEIADLKSAIDHASRQVRDATAWLEAAQDQEQERESARTDAELAHRKQETRLHASRHQATQLRADIERADRRGEQALAQLSDLTRPVAASNAAFPAPDDLDAIDAELVALPATVRVATASRVAAEQRDRLLTLARDRETAAMNLEREIPPLERPRVRARWAVLHDELQQAADDLVAARTAANVAGRDEQVARQAAEQAEQQQVELLRRAKASRAEAVRHRETRDRLLLGLSPEERPNVLTLEVVAALADELDRLVDAPERLRHLEAARREVVHVEGEQKSLTEQIERIPKDDRRPVAAAQAELDDAERVLANARCRERESDLSLTRAREAAGEAQQLDGELRLLQQREGDFRLLESLLGREHLQGRLVEEARIGIAEAAQRELDAISNGTLTLDLRRTEDGEHLELLVADHSSVHRPIEATYLSGSQKFRVAVALALGIGQYISGAARGRRAVIIDEGFGSLDEDGIDAMAAHLRDLSDRLDRVLLVTHQASMQRHFRCGFRVDKRDGAAVVTAWAN